MGYARHIGRVGALAVTLGVGAAIANAPGIAYAETPGASPGGDSSQKTESPSTDNSSSNRATTGRQGAATADADADDSSASDRRSQRRSVLRSVVGAIRDIADGSLASVNAAGATGRHEKQDSAAGDSVDRKTSITSTNTTRLRARTNDLADAADDVESAVTSFTQRVEQAVQKFTAPGLASTPSGAATPAPQTFTTAVTPTQ